jgi:hypothetical protein
VLSQASQRGLRLDFLEVVFFAVDLFAVVFGASSTPHA